MMIPVNFEARRYEDAHQAKSLAQWCGGIVPAGDPGEQQVPVILAPVEGGTKMASQGDWIIRQPDGTVRIEGPGTMDGYCADCGEPVWWHDEQLVTRDDRRWCFGPGRTRVAMERWHALPGMRQYAVPAATGQPCHCLARSGPHVHQVTDLACGQCDHGLIPVGHCTCDTGPEGQHQPFCGSEPCPAGCWEKLHPPVPDPCQALTELRWAPYQEFGIPDPDAESFKAPAGPVLICSTGYRDGDIIVYWRAPDGPENWASLPYQRRTHPPCQACGTWICAACGWRRAGAALDQPELQRCGHCGYHKGEFVPTRHQQRTRTYEDHNPAAGPACETWDLAHERAGSWEPCNHPSCRTITWKE